MYGIWERCCSILQCRSALAWKEAFRWGHGLHVVVFFFDVDLSQRRDEDEDEDDEAGDRGWRKSRLP